MKLYIHPNYGKRPDKADGGIRRVVEAQKKFLPKMGIEIVDNPEDADVINNHGASLVSIPGIPSVNSCHGFMWSNYEWGSWAHDINRAVVRSMTHAVAHTAPSMWVRDAMVRGMLVDPTVIYHGVDPDEWDATKHKEDYVLWNKARKDKVSDPEDMNQVAGLLPGVKFLSTIGRKADNVRISGVMPYPEMKNLIETAGVYLATARETFGIGTLEAMVCGVPVVGWDWGGQSEIIVHNETGYLAEPGDYKDLARGIEICLKNKHEMGEAAREDVLDRWGWEDKIEKYADVFWRVYEDYTQERPKVSVIVTSYNLGHYLSDALDSVERQTEESWECIIVDDCSTDNSSEIAKSYANKDNRFVYRKPDTNLGLSIARNFGVSNSHGQYLIMLDADDMLEKNALKILSGELDKDWEIDVAFGHLDTFTDGDPTLKRNNWPLKEFDWRQQMAHLNQLPYSSMMRREVFERSGGYRKRHWRAEDAAFWCRVSSFGFRIKKVTQASTLLYRMRGDSKSNGEPGDGDWTAWYPWRIAGSPREGSEKIRDGYQVPAHLVPWGAPHDKGSGEFWPVQDRSKPFVSVIIPVGPGHEDLVIDALESLVAQTYTNWEAIVVNDTGDPLDLKHAPYAKVYDTSQLMAGMNGPAFPRNHGARMAKGKTLLWLDADDFLMPDALQKMVEVYNENGPAIVYSDWLKNEGDTKKVMEYYPAPEFKCGAVLKKLQHSVTCLVPRKSHNLIGGFDEGIPGWEDWDYYIALQDAGLCSYRIPEALFVYRFYGGSRREESFDMRKDLLQYIRNKWDKYYLKEIEMACGGCSSKRNRVPSAVKKETTIVPNTTKVYNGYSMIIVEYVGKPHGPFRVNGIAPTNAKYKFGKAESSRFGYVYPHDVEHLLRKRNQDGSSMFVVVPPAPPKKEEVKTEDFVGQKVEPAPEVQPEPEVLEEFILDVSMNDLTAIKVRELLKDKRYLRREIINAFISQESTTRNRKTVMTALRKELDRLP